MQGPKKLFEGATPSASVAPPAQVESSTDAGGRVAGFTLPFSFDLATWQLLFGAVRDGDYWSAGRYAVSILNAILNPAPNVRATHPVALTDAESVAFAKQIAFVQAKCAELAALDPDEDRAPMVHANVPGAPEFGITDIIAIIQILGPIFQKWRENRKKQQ